MPSTGGVLASFQLACKGGLMRANATQGCHAGCEFPSNAAQMSFHEQLKMNGRQSEHARHVQNLEA